MTGSSGRPARVVLAATVVAALLAPALDRPLINWLWTWGQTGGGWYWAQAADILGHGNLQIPLCLLWLLAGWRWRPAERWWGGAALAANLGAGLVTQVLKHLLGRPRPFMDMDPLLFQGLGLDSDMHSFPSGHTSTSFALAAVLAARFPRAAWLFYLAAGLVGLGRVVGGSHYLSDVVGGAVVGLMLGLPLAELARRRASDQQRRAPREAAA
jgi:undecaprenyl-diphosphatase